MFIICLLSTFGTHTIFIISLCDLLIVLDLTVFVLMFNDSIEPTFYDISFLFDDFSGKHSLIRVSYLIFLMLYVPGYFSITIYITR
jgi:hypothetical protein